MQEVTVGEFKANFSEYLERVSRGEEITISFGKKRKRVAVLLPYVRHTKAPERKLGLFKARGRCVIRKGFKFTDEDMLLS
ncbi:MAG: type II toxin-antitoxin system prevent-host-death family antitoxin [Thermodesulfobacteriota bacterium]